MLDDHAITGIRASSNVHIVGSGHVRRSPATARAAPCAYDGTRFLQNPSRMPIQPEERKTMALMITAIDLQVRSHDASVQSHAPPSGGARRPEGS